MVGDGKFGIKPNATAILGVGLKETELYKKLTNRVYFVKVPKLAVTNDDDIVMLDNINGRSYRPSLQTMVVRGLTILDIINIYEQGYAILATDKKEIKSLIDHINEYLGEFPKLKSIPNLNAYDTKLLNRLESFGQEILRNQSNYLSNLEIKYEDKLSEMGIFNPNGESIYKNVDVELNPKVKPSDIRNDDTDDIDDTDNIVRYSRFGVKRWSR